MSLLLPPRPPKHQDPPVDQDALIEEARRRVRRRRQRNLAGSLAAILGALCLYSLLGGAGPQSGSAFLSEASSSGAAGLKAALPEELTYNASGGVFLVRRDGTQRAFAPGVVRRLPHGWLLRFYSGLEWSPDGSKLLALRWQSRKGLVVVGANGKIGLAIAAKALDGRWSPDGSRIAFVRREPGAGRTLFVASSDGRNVVRLATHLQVFGSFSWSPDGTALAYAGQGTSGLFVVDAGGRAEPRPIPILAAPGESVRAGATVRWSPNGSLIAFTTGQGVYAVRPDGTSLRPIAKGYDFAWSPDSRLLAVAGPAGPTWGDVSVVGSDGTRLHRIAHATCAGRGATCQWIAWSPDGSRIAYISGRGDTVSTVRPDGSGATVVGRPTPFSGGLQPTVPLWRPIRAR